MRDADILPVRAAFGQTLLLIGTAGQAIRIWKGHPKPPMRKAVGTFSLFAHISLPEHLNLPNGCSKNPRNSRTLLRKSERWRRVVGSRGDRALCGLFAGLPKDRKFSFGILRLPEFLVSNRQSVASVGIFRIQIH